MAIIPQTDPHLLSMTTAIYEEGLDALDARLMLQDYLEDAQDPRRHLLGLVTRLMRSSGDGDTDYFEMRGNGIGYSIFRPKQGLPDGDPPRRLGRLMSLAVIGLIRALTHDKGITEWYVELFSRNRKRLLWTELSACGLPVEKNPPDIILTYTQQGHHFAYGQKVFGLLSGQTRFLAWSNVAEITTANFHYDHPTRLGIVNMRKHLYAASEVWAAARQFDAERKSTGRAIHAGSEHA